MSRSDSFQRLISLEGGFNLRDVGGYPTATGRRVESGMVYRAASLGDLSDGDHATLERLGLRVIFDLRSTRERTRNPSRLGASACEVWSRDHDSSAADLIRKVARGDTPAEEAREAMLQLYRQLPYEQADSYRELFRRIVDGCLPLLFHCSAGKDRTGVAAALLLDLLGVPRAVILEDYLLTEQFFDRLMAKIGKDAMTRGLVGVPVADWEPLIRADPAYLAELFSTIDRQHGGTRGYLSEELGFTESETDRIREKLLTVS